MINKDFQNLNLQVRIKIYFMAGINKKNEKILDMIYQIISFNLNLIRCMVQIKISNKIKIYKMSKKNQKKLKKKKKKKNKKKKKMMINKIA